MNHKVLCVASVLAIILCACGDPDEKKSSDDNGSSIVVNPGNVVNSGGPINWPAQPVSLTVLVMNATTNTPMPSADLVVEQASGYSMTSKTNSSGKKVFVNGDFHLHGFITSGSYGAGLPYDGLEHGTQLTVVVTASVPGLSSASTSVTMTYSEPNREISMYIK